MKVIARDGRVALEFSLSLQGPSSERPDRFITWLLEIGRDQLARTRIIKTGAAVPQSRPVTVH